MLQRQLADWQPIENAIVEVDERLTHVSVESQISTVKLSAMNPVEISCRLFN
jgi:hypothetical protein